MIEYILSHLGEIGSVLTIIISIMGAILWSHRKLHADIMEIRQDVRHAHDRIDSLGLRIDKQYVAFGEMQRDFHQKFYEMQKEISNARYVSDQKFYDLLIEGRK